MLLAEVIEIRSYPAHNRYVDVTEIVMSRKVVHVYVSLVSIVSK